jgi:NADH-quinone oxidoreductase subunit J
VTALGWTTVALGVVAVVCGLLVFRLDSMARVTFLLLASFVAVAADVAALGLCYLGVVIILMMTVEMVIMVVFMVMLMMNPAGLMPMTMVHNPWGARAVALVVFGVLTAGALLVPWPIAAPPALPAPDPTAALGEALMGPQMLVMMTLGLALLATIVGTVALSVPRGRYAEADETDDGSRTASRTDEGAEAAR